jgi:hypothetical protein
MGVVATQDHWEHFGLRSVFHGFECNTKHKLLTRPFRFEALKTCKPFPVPSVHYWAKLPQRKRRGAVTAPDSLKDLGTITLEFRALISMDLMLPEDSTAGFAAAETTRIHERAVKGKVLSARVGWVVLNRRLTASDAEN